MQLREQCGLLAALLALLLLLTVMLLRVGFQMGSADAASIPDKLVDAVCCTNQTTLETQI
jgi:hypothetical protein